MNDNKATLISKGFWLGIGLIMPIGFGMAVGSQFIRFSEGAFNNDEDADASYVGITTDYTKLIKIDNHRDQSKNGVIDIVGTIINTGNEPIGSVKIEAEFFNKSGEFVMERSEYIDKKIQPKEAENFQISCDCQNQIPRDYEKITLKVVSAHNF